MEKFNVLIQAYQHLKNTQRNVVLYNNEISDAERRVPPSRLPECKHRRHVTQVGLLLSGPSSNWEFTSSRDLFTSLNSEIPTSEQSGTRHYSGSFW